MATSASTPALKVLVRNQVAHSVHSFDSGTDHFGAAAAAALNERGIVAERIFKTLVVDLTAGEGSTRLLGVACVPVTGSLSLKKAAAAFHVSKISMADPHEASKVTGYIPGGISPIGQRKRLATLVDSSALDFDTIFVSGGKRGLDIEIAAQDLLRVTGATVAPIAAAGHGLTHAPQQP